MDPSYSVLLATDDSDPCAEHYKYNSISTTIYIAVLVPVFGVIALLLAIFFIYPKVKLWRQLKKAHNTQRSETSLLSNSGWFSKFKTKAKSSSNIPIEKRGTIEMSSAAGSFVMQM